MSKKEITRKEQEGYTTTIIEGNLCKAGGSKEDDILKICAVSDMETQLSGAPQVLTVLGYVALIAAEGKDYSIINENDPNAMQKFKFLKHQNFRSCLTQVGNETFNALKTAHGNMSFIGMSMKKVPEYMKDVVILLTKDTPAKVQSNLPIYLGSIKKIAEQGQDKVKEVLERFDVTINTLNELIEANQTARADNERVLAITQMNKKIAEREKEEFEKELKQCEAELEEMKEKIKREERELKESLEKTGSWNDFGHQASRTVIDQTTAILPGLAMAGGLSLLTSSMSDIESIGMVAAVLGREGIEKATSLKMASNQATTEKEEAKNPKNIHHSKDLDASARRIEDGVCENFESLFNDDKRLCFKTLKNNMILNEAEAVLQKEKTVIDDLVAKMENRNSAKTLKKIHKRLKKLLDEFRNAEKSDSDENYPRLYTDTSNLTEEIQEFQLAMSSTNLKDLNNPQSPSMYQKAKSALSGSSKSSLTDTYVKQMFTKLEIQKEQLRSTEKRADETRERKRAQNRKLQETINELATFNETKATKEEVLVIIAKGLAALHEMRKQWMQLYIYFKNIENVMQTVMGPAMDMFIQLSNVAGKDMIENGDNLSILARDRLYKQAFSAVRVAEVVHYMATSYESISNKHLMPMIDHFGEIISLDSRLDGDRIKSKYAVLNEDGAKAQQAIGHIIEDGHKQFKDNVERRLSEIEQIFEEQLPPLPVEERKQITNRVQAMCKKVSEENTDEQELDIADFC